MELSAETIVRRQSPAGVARLETRLPHIAKQLADGISRVERAARAAQDVEFTVEDGRLFFLQTRAAKLTPLATLRIAVDMVHEGLIDIGTALERVGDIDGMDLTIARFSEPAPSIAEAISASPGVASGRVAFDSHRAKELASNGEPVILVRPDTSTEDVAGFAVAAGILTATGGHTAHAAVVARQLDKVCLVGCYALALDEKRRVARIGTEHIQEGDWLSLDGDAGTVALGKRAILKEQPPELAEIEHWRTQGAHVPA